MNINIKKIFLFIAVFSLVSYGFVTVANVHAAEKLGKLTRGEGKWGKFWRPIEMYRWWDPLHYFEPDNKIEGTFVGIRCVNCHNQITPGIVIDWKASAHSDAGVTCDKCHGNDHQKLRLPTPDICEKCHPEQVEEFNSEKKAGHPAHARAFHPDVVEAGWQISKPQPEVAGCAQCHSIENKCDSCHFRHVFRASEARRPEACGFCHNGPDHRDMECYQTSVHGVITKIDGDNWDWNKPLRVGNYRAPTCAYCHMYEGTHNAIENAIYSHMGVQEVDRGAEEHAGKRKGWLNICNDCHSSRFAAAYLRGADETVKVSHMKVREAKAVVEDLQKDGFLEAMPKDLAPYLDEGHKWNLGGRMYNITEIERTWFDMLVYQGTTIFKAAFHMSANLQTYELGAFKQDESLLKVKSEASKLRRIRALEKKVGIKYVPHDFWKKGEYTDKLIIIK
ncbi:MAG: multiheme c-type cytochrome [Candidatus Scalinduaceae bacterium]